MDALFIPDPLLVDGHGDIEPRQAVDETVFADESLGPRRVRLHDERGDERARLAGPDLDRGDGPGRLRVEAGNVEIVGQARLLARVDELAGCGRAVRPAEARDRARRGVDGRGDRRVLQSRSGQARSAFFWALPGVNGVPLRAEARHGPTRGRPARPSGAAATARPRHRRRGRGRRLRSSPRGG